MVAMFQALQDQEADEDEEDDEEDDEEEVEHILDSDEE